MFEPPTLASLQIPLIPLRARLKSARIYPESIRGYFQPRMASFAALATRNFTTRLAGI
jgi:hypothetical protein